MIDCWVFFFFFSSRRRHTRCREVSWARRCVQETGLQKISALLQSKNPQAQESTKDGARKNKRICEKRNHCSKLQKFKGHLHQAVRSRAILGSGYAYPVSYTHLTLPTILLVQISVVAVSLKKKKKKQNQNTRTGSHTRRIEYSKHQAKRE
eukprot:TRINITY_DN5466_c0_g1_i12.p1 TRINITY_DN5466_c0_g1~~TRINITY_DN5466_c0_g1_i12.p1  ORF type:complete len:151 (+),score=50.01 TRINITY_DN5466_c0_g1_i12:80-532(+)